MIGRAFILTSCLCGAATLSQFPEFSQQYTQRLSGAVDELRRVVQDFDASASAEGLSREQALTQMTGTAFVERRRIDMERTISRSIMLAGDLETLRDASPLTRFLNAGRFTDTEIAARAWADFRPAIPLTLTGLVFAAIGLVMGYVGGAAIVSLIRFPFVRKSHGNAT